MVVSFPLRRTRRAAVAKHQKDEMDILMIFLSTLASTIAGGAIGIGLVVAYFIGIRTKEKALHGSLQQRLIAYCLRICAVLGAYSVILLSARAMYAFTERTVFDALMFLASLVGILLLARRKLRT